MPPQHREARASIVGDIAQALYRSMGHEKWYTASIDAKVRTAGESISTVVRRAIIPCIDDIVLQLRVVDALAAKLERAGRLPPTQLPEGEELLLAAWAGARLGVPRWRDILRADRRRYFTEKGRNCEFRQGELGAALRLPSPRVVPADGRPDYLEVVLGSCLQTLMHDALAQLSQATVQAAAPAIRELLRPAIESLRARVTVQARMLDALHPDRHPPHVLRDLLVSMAGPATRRRPRSTDDKLELCHEFWVRCSRGEIDWHGFLLKDLSEREYERVLCSDDPLLLGDARLPIPRNAIDVEASVRRALSWIWDSWRPSIEPVALDEGLAANEDWPAAIDAERRALRRFQRFVAVIEPDKKKRIHPVILLEIAQLRTTEVGRELTWAQLLNHIRELGSSTTRSSLTREDRPSDAAIISEYHRKCEITNRVDASVRPTKLLGSRAGSLAPDDSSIYIQRDADVRLRDLIASGREPVIVLSGPRKIGKTTLANRAARSDSHIQINFQGINGVEAVRTAEELERLVLAEVEREKARRRVSEPRLVLVDEVDRVPRARHVDLVRLLPSLGRTSVLVSMFPIEGLEGLPRVLVPPFDRGKVKELIEAYERLATQESENDAIGNNLLLAGEDDRARLLRELGGNPYLVHLAVDTVFNNLQSLLTFLHHPFEERNPLSIFLRGVASELRDEPELLAALQALMQGKSVEDSAMSDALIRNGLAAVDGVGKLVPLCGIYRWILANAEE